MADEAEGTTTTITTTTITSTSDSANQDSTTIFSSDEYEKEETPSQPTFWDYVFFCNFCGPQQSQPSPQSKDDSDTPKELPTEQAPWLSFLFPQPPKPIPTVSSSTTGYVTEEVVVVSSYTDETSPLLSTSFSDVYTIVEPPHFEEITETFAAYSEGEEPVVVSLVDESSRATPTPTEVSTTVDVKQKKGLKKIGKSFKEMGGRIRSIGRMKTEKGFKEKDE